MTLRVADCRAAELRFDDACVRAAARALPGAGAAGRPGRGAEPPSGTRGGRGGRQLGAETTGLWNATRGRSEQSPRLALEPERAARTPRRPHPFPRARGFRDLARALRRGPPFSPGEGATSLLLGLDDLKPLPARFCFQTAVPLVVAPPHCKALGNPHPHPRERPRGAGGGQKGEPGTVPKPSRGPRVEVRVGDRGLQSPPAPVQRGGTKGREEKDMTVCFRPQTSAPAPRAATTACREAEGAKGARAASPRRPWPGLGPRRHLPRPRLAH